MKKFLFFRGFVENDFLDIDWDAINRLNNLDTIINPITTIPMWTGTTYTPTWVVNPGLITYTPGYYGTITTTPGTYTIPYSGTINTATGFSLTTSNTNGTTYTTANFGGTLTTNTAFLNTEILTGTSTSSTNFK